MKKLEIKKDGGISIILLDNNLTQNDYLSMREQIKERCFDKGNINIVIDCDVVAVLPSIAFGVFCSVSRDAKRLGGFCVLIHVSKNINEILSMTHADKLVQILNSLADVKEELVMH